MLIELKPCPFCGSAAELRERWGDCSKRPDWYEVQCLNPDCGQCHDTEAEAVEAWNRRADAEALREMLVKLYNYARFPYRDLTEEEWERARELANP